VPAGRTFESNPQPPSCGTGDHARLHRHWKSLNTTRPHCCGSGTFTGVLKVIASNISDGPAGFVPVRPAVHPALARRGDGFARVVTRLADGLLPQSGVAPMFCSHCANAAPLGND